MKLEQALKRIEELELRVRELEARPAQNIHYHTHQAPAPHYDRQPRFIPSPTIWPSPYIADGGAAS